MAIKNRQVLKALFAKSDMARELANLVDSALIRPDDSFYGKWNPNVVYKNGDVVLHGHALYMLVVDGAKSSACEDDPVKKIGRKNPLPPDAVTEDREWFNITEPQVFYLNDGSAPDGIYFIKKKATDFHPFKEPKEQGEILIHIKQDGKVSFSGYNGTGAHLEVKGAVAAKKYYQKMMDISDGEILEIADALGKLEQLKPIAFRKKKGKFQSEESPLVVGFDPSTLTDFLPEILNPAEEKQIDAQAIVPILVKAVQDLKRELDIEKNRSDSLVQELKSAAAERAHILHRLEKLENPKGNIDPRTNTGY